MCETSGMHPCVMHYICYLRLTLSNAWLLFTTVHCYKLLLNEHCICIIVSMVNNF